MNKSQRKLKVVDSFYAQVMERWAVNREDAHSYLAAVVGNLGPKAPDLLNLLPLPLAQKARVVIASRTTEKNKAIEVAAQLSLLRSAETTDKELTRRRLLEFHMRKLFGHERIIFIAGLQPQDRHLVGTAEERSAAGTLRKRTILSAKVRSKLKCTATELDRWNADGRLPHLYLRAMRFGKTTPSRCWDPDLIETAIGKVASWRTQDAIKKRFAKYSLSLVAGQ
jgi:hypothetical protein